METKQVTENPSEEAKPWLANFWGMQKEKPPEQKAQEAPKKKMFMPWEREFWIGKEAPKTAPKPPESPKEYQPLYPTEKAAKEAVMGSDTGSGYTKKVLRELEAELSNMSASQRAEFKKLKGQLGA